MSLPKPNLQQGQGGDFQQYAAANNLQPVTLNRQMQTQKPVNVPTFTNEQLLARQQQVTDPVQIDAQNRAAQAMNRLQADMASGQGFNQPNAARFSGQQQASTSAAGPRQSAKYPQQ